MAREEEAGAYSAEIDVFGHFVQRWQRRCTRTRFLARCTENAPLCSPMPAAAAGQRLIPQQRCCSHAVDYKCKGARQEASSTLAGRAAWGKAAAEDVGSSCGCQELSVIVQRREENPPALYILFIYWVSSPKRCKALCVHGSPLVLLTLSGKHTAAAETSRRAAIPAAV